jgi:hypothetical protein
MNLQGVLIGAVAFIIIGVFHPIVIRAEFRWGTPIWPAFLVAGLAFSAASLFVADTVWAAILGVAGFSSLWSIREVFEQAERVRKGWFPQNPKRGK